MVYITSLSTLNLAQMIVEIPLEIPRLMLRHFILPVPDLPNHDVVPRPLLVMRWMSQSINCQ